MFMHDPILCRFDLVGKEDGSHQQFEVAMGPGAIMGAKAEEVDTPISDF